MPSLAATLWTLLGIALLCGLGMWQLQRLEWKTKIITELDTEYARNAAGIFINPDQLEKTFDYRRGTLTGQYDLSKQIRIGPRVYGNLPGYHVVTPLKLEDGSYLLVNRGWVPQDWTFADEATPPGGIIHVTGLLRKPMDQNPFTPANEPDKNQWYHIDFKQIAQIKNLPRLHPYVLYREGNETEGDYPLAQTSRPDLPNNHLQYAIFWFSMAGIVFVMYVFSLVKK